MALKKLSSEGGTDNAGATGGVTTTNSATSNNGGAGLFSVTPGAGGTINYTSASSAHGSLSVEMTQSTAATSCHVEFSDTAAADFAARVYVKLSALPSAELQFPMSLRTAAGSNCCWLQMTATGIVKVAANAATVFTGTVAAGTGTWYRYELWGTGSGLTTATVNYAMFAGDSTSALESTTLTNVNLSAGQIGRVGYGKRSSATLAVWQMDDLAANIGSSTQIGPEADLEAPSVPTGLTVTSVGSTTANLSWTASTDNVAVTGYEVTIFGP